MNLVALTLMRSDITWIDYLIGFLIGDCVLEKSKEGMEFLPAESHDTKIYGLSVG